MRSLFPVFTLYSNISTDYAFGVADGVGGWRQHGVDPGEFSRTVLFCELISPVVSGEYEECYYSSCRE